MQCFGSCMRWKSGFWQVRQNFLCVLWVLIYPKWAIFSHVGVIEIISRLMVNLAPAVSIRSS